MIWCECSHSRNLSYSMRPCALKVALLMLGKLANNSTYAYAVRRRDWISRKQLPGDGGGGDTLDAAA